MSVLSDTIRRWREKENLRDAFCCVLSALAVLLIYAVILGGAWLAHGKEHTFLFGDALIQYIHFIVMFYRHLFEGGSLNYTFELGLGMPTRAVYAYYTLSPFDLVFLLVRDPEKAGVCLVTLKMMMSGAMFSLLLRRTQKTGVLTTLFCSVSYALCGYAMLFSFGYVLQDCLYILPLLMLFLIRFVQEGKWKGLCLVYAASFVIQFYCGYMTGVFSVVLLAVLLWEKCGKQGRLWGAYILKFLQCVFIAVILSAPVTLPAALEIFAHMGKDATALKQLKLMPWDLLSGLYPGHVEDVYNHIPLTYAGMPAVLLTVRYFADPRHARKKKIAMAIPLLFLLLCSFFKPAYLLIHAFDAPDGYCYRFSWMFSFWLLYISAQELNGSGESGKVLRDVLPAVAFGAGYFILYALQQHFSGEEYRILSLKTGGMCLLFLVLYALLFIAGSRRPKLRMLLLPLLAAELIWNGEMVQDYNAGNITGNREYYGIWQEQAQNAMHFIEEQEQADPWQFYRVRNSNCLNDNISMLYGYRGLGYFSTIEHEASRHVLERLGYSTSPRVVQDYGSMPFTRMIFAQKYSLDSGFWRGKQRGYYMLNKNPQVLPAAFMVSEDLLDFSFSSNDPFENQNRLAEAMTGEEGGVYDSYAGGYSIDAEGVEISVAEDGFLLHRVAESGVGQVEYTFQPEGEKKLYVYVSCFGQSGNSASSVVFSNEDIGGMLGYSLLDMPHIIPLTTEENGLAHLYIMMVENSEDIEDYETIFAAYEDPEKLDAVYRMLSPGGMIVEEAQDDMIRGTVCAEEERSVLFTSIPYEKGWKAFVDGNPAETVPVLDDAFLAVVLEPGTHEVCFRFENPAVMPAYLLGLLGVLLLLLPLKHGRKEQ